MLDAVDMVYGNNLGPMSSIMGKSREQKMADRAEAIKAGQGVGDREQLEAKVREVSEGFVSVFMNQVMKSMRATVHENPQMHGDNGEKFFQEMLDTEYSKSLAAGSGYGLTDLVYQSLISSYRLQDQAAADRQAGAGVAEPAEPEVAVQGIG